MGKIIKMKPEKDLTSIKPTKEEKLESYRQEAFFVTAALMNAFDQNVYSHNKYLKKNKPLRKKASKIISKMYELYCELAK